MGLEVSQTAMGLACSLRLQGTSLTRPGDFVCGLLSLGALDQGPEVRVL